MLEGGRTPGAALREILSRERSNPPPGVDAPVDDMAGWEMGIAFEKVC